MIGKALEFLQSNKDALQTAAAIVGSFTALVALLGIWIAGAQIRETRQQRAVSESLELSSQLDASLRAWKTCVDSKSADLAVCVGHTLTLYEIIAGALINGLFTRNTRPLLRNHIRDGLGVLCSSRATRIAIKALARDKHVCISTRRFLLKNTGLFRKSARHRSVYETFFPDFRTDIILGGSMRGFWTRRMLRVYARFVNRIP